MGKKVHSVLLHKNLGCILCKLNTTRLSNFLHRLLLYVSLKGGWLIFLCDQNQPVLLHGVIPSQVHHSTCVHLISWSCSCPLPSPQLGLSGWQPCPQAYQLVLWICCYLQTLQTLFYCLPFLIKALHRMGPRISPCITPLVAGSGEVRGIKHLLSKR